MQTEVLKVKVGRYLIPLELTYKGNRIFVKFPFNRTLIADIKQMEGARWHGYDEPNPRKIWSIANSARNHFRLRYMAGENPYEPYDAELIEVEPNRSLYAHQIEMLQHALTRRHCIFAGEMGTGKSLVFIEMLDHIDFDIQDHEIWYVGPKSGVVAVRREFVKWASVFRPEFMTYRGLVTKVKNWEPGMSAPRVLCLDESSCIKTPSSQRSQAARHVANAMREEHGRNSFIIEMSGTPAPKEPPDWWHQCEVACPGFLKEGSHGHLKMRMALVEQRESISGGSYPHLITWLDNEWKCAKCGQNVVSPTHDMKQMEDYDHEFQKSVNEVSLLYERMKGLVIVKKKKDCLDLPEKQYRIINIKPNIETLRAARLIRKTSPRAIQTLTLLRELSDGFQYREEVIGKETCPQCKGTGTYKGKLPREDVDPMDPLDVKAEDFVEGDIDCNLCDENCEVDVKRRVALETGSVKDDVLIELLEEHEECGRFVIWGGFTATIDRAIQICHQQGWATLRIDKKGYIAESATGERLSSDDFLDAMDATNPRRNELMGTYPKIAVVGHPKAGGHALTFNISPTALFYSNVFDGEARMQAEDRIHRIGMDDNRGCTIIDLIHLPTDQLVLNNLQKKKDLQNLTLGEIDDSLSAYDKLLNET